MAMRWAIVLAAVGMLAALLTGCGSSSNVAPYSASPTTSARPTTTAPRTTSAVPTTTAAPTTTAVVKATSTEIRTMTLCQALAKGRAAIGFIVYPNSAAKACAEGAPGASVLLLCDAIYDGSTGELRATSSGQTSDPSVVAACPSSTLTPSATPTTGPLPGTDVAPAPLGGTRTGTWWQAATSSVAIANLWYFDPSGSSGVTREYRETGAGGQQTFAYQATAGSGTVSMAFPGGVQRTLRVLSYDRSTDSLTVELDGTVQQWVGCGSTRMPAAARSTCQ